MLELEGVHAFIGQFHILQGVSLRVPPGSVTVLLGRNGAGKTTTLRTIMVLVPCRAGSITLEGRRIDRLAPYEVARLGIGYVPEDRGVFTGLTVEENLRLAARGPRRAWRDRQDRLLGLFPDLAKAWRRRAGTLSGGQQQMLAIARALVNPNRLLLIDEPSKGLAPQVVRGLTEALAHVKEGTTILLVEQNLAMARALGDRYVILDDGRTVHHGLMADLAADQSLQRNYLGVREVVGR